MGDLDFLFHLCVALVVVFLFGDPLACVVGGGAVAVVADFDLVAITLVALQLVDQIVVAMVERVGVHAGVEVGSAVAWIPKEVLVGHAGVVSDRGFSMALRDAVRAASCLVDVKVGVICLLT